MAIYDWSTTASNNATADSTILWAEFQDPSTVNDSARAMMARIAEWRQDVAPTRSSTGTGNAYAVTSQSGDGAGYRDGEIVTFIADRTNSSACTLNVNARGAKPFRPAVGVDFRSGEIQASQAIIAFYREATEEFVGVGSGYHVNAMTTGLLSQSIAARLIKIGTPVLSIAPTAPAGYIRLTETTQTINKSAWPELSSWLAGLSTPYPWGSTSTTFNLPPAAGYVLRFAGTTTTIDPDGPRTAGSTQTDLVKAHTHTGTTSAGSAHSHTMFQESTGAGAVLSSSDDRVGDFANISTELSYELRKGTTSTEVGRTATESAHTHTFTTAANTGAENRPKNVAMHVDIFASSQLSAGTLAMFGFPYAWDTGTTAADPGAARVRGDNATLGSITALYISETDAWGVNIATVLGAITNGSVLRLSKVGAQANTVVLTVAGSITDNGSYRTIPVTVSAVSGAFAADDSLAFELAGGAGATGPAATVTVGTVTTGSAGSSATVTNIGTSGAAVLDFSIPRGDAGAVGANGTDPGIRWLFDTSTTTNADPGAGDLRFNNATLASVTEMAISYSSGETGNPSVETFVKAWDDSTTTGTRGTLILKKVSAPQNFAIYTITSAITDGTTYGRFTLSYLAGSGSFTAADPLAVQFSRTGDKGADGVGTGDVVGPASATNDSLARYDGTTGKLLKNGAVIGTDVQAYDATLASIATLGTAADKIAYTTGVDTWAETPLTSTARGLLDDTSQGAMQTTLGLVPGTNVQAYDAELTALAGLTSAADKVPYFTGSGTAALADLSSAMRTFLTTSSSANLRSLLTDETGTGVAYFQGGDAGTPSAITLTNGTGLPVAGITASTSTALGVGSVELGHATDTTLARSAAGEVTIEGTLIQKAGRQTIWIPASAMTARTTNGAAAGTAEMTTNKNMFSTLDFDWVTAEYAQFEIHMPKSWNLGTVTFQPVMSHASGTGNVIFALAGVARSDDDAGDVAFGTVQSSTKTVGTANDIYIGPESSAITIAGTPAAGDTVQFQINRDVADTLGVDARLHGIRLFFTTNASTDA